MTARVIAVTAAGATIAIVLLVGTGVGWWGGSVSAPASRLSVRATLTPTSTLYGDAVAAIVVVSGAVGGPSPVVEPSFAPYAPIGPATVSRTTAGRRVTFVYRYELQCVTGACLPVGKQRQITFPNVTVTAGGKHTTASWPPLVVASRLTPAELAASQPPVKTASVPSATFAVSPGTLSSLLIAAAAVLTLAAAAVFYLELAAFLRARHERRPRLTGLALALAYARDAASRPEPADRRRAVELLAETLRRDAPGLADAAEAVAWSEVEPTPEQTLELVAAVESQADVA